MIRHKEDLNAGQIKIAESVFKCNFHGF